MYVCFLFSILKKLGFPTSVPNADNNFFLFFFFKNTYYLLVKTLVMVKSKKTKIFEKIECLNQCIIKLK